MFQNDNHFSSIVKQHFLGQLSKDCKETFYIPKIEFPPNFSKEITVLNPKNKGFMNDFLVNDLIL